MPKITPFGPIEDLRNEVESVTKDVKELGRLPVVTFSAGGISTPADAALMMRQGMDGVFVGSGIFKSSDPPTYCRGHCTGHPLLQRSRSGGRGLGDDRRAYARPRNRELGRQNGRQRLVNYLPRLGLIFRRLDFRPSEVDGVLFRVSSPVPPRVIAPEESNISARLSAISSDSDGLVSIFLA